MAKGLAILDTWLMMLIATAFLWFGVAGLYTDGVEAKAVVALIGGAVGCALVALMGRVGEKRDQLSSLGLRFAIVGCLAYFAWFQPRPWFALDDSALVRGSFRQEFLLQRLQQTGVFLLFTVPLIILGIWRSRSLSSTVSATTNRRASSVILVGVVILALGAALAARLVGPPKLEPISWVCGAVLVAAVLLELARRVNQADRLAVVAFASVVVMTPVLLLWK